LASDEPDAFNLVTKATPAPQKCRTSGRHSATGSALVYSNYVDGTNGYGDSANAIAVDAASKKVRSDWSDGESSRASQANSGLGIAIFREGLLPRRVRAGRRHATSLLRNRSPFSSERGRKTNEKTKGPPVWQESDAILGGTTWTDRNRAQEKTRLQNIVNIATGS
jgi:hypothetical protein